MILECVGPVAYKLKLPSGSHIHDVFHVSQLKKFHGSAPLISQIPDWFNSAIAEPELQPAAILAS